MQQIFDTIPPNIGNMCQTLSLVLGKIVMNETDIVSVLMELPDVGDKQIIKWYS